jgi:hypothetical protein
MERQQVESETARRGYERRVEQCTAASGHGRWKSTKTARVQEFCLRALERMQGTWCPSETESEEMRAIEAAVCGAEAALHPGAEELGLIGAASLFERLNTTRTGSGAERLAEFLLRPATLSQARARQSAVRELSADETLGERMALLGRYRFVRCGADRFRQWLALDSLSVPRGMRWLLLAAALTTLSVAVCVLAGFSSWNMCAPWLGLALAVQGVLVLRRRDAVEQRLLLLAAMADDLAVLREGLALVAGEAFKAEPLRALQKRLQQREASRTLRRLERMALLASRREHPELMGFSLWLAGGTQLVWLAEDWRVRYGKSMAEWLDVWAEFEALAALALYARESEGCFPDLVEAPGHVYLLAMRHPLLDARKAVANDLLLDAEHPFFVLSGSNMAGKSTLLRAMGLNAVLAVAGAPVTATSARMCVFHVCVSMGVRDALSQGRSRFLAEIERMRETVHAADAGVPVLFLIDEILSGTNSEDRLVAAEALVKRLVQSGAVGALSTHDLALTSLADSIAPKGANFCMQSADENDPLAFDYRMRLGVCQQRNGWAIVRRMGLA